MAITPTIKLEMNWGATILDAENNAILDAADEAILDGGWANALEDTRGTLPIRIKRGNFGLGQLDRVADVGTMSFGLNNSESNSEATLGLFSPSHDNARSSFDETTKTRFYISSAGNTRYKYQGIRLDVIDPDSGQYGRRATSCTAVDWMDEALTAPAKGLAVQLAKRDDQLLALLTGIMENPPESTSYALGPDQYGASFHDIRSENTKVAGVLQSLALSGLGTVFLNGTALSGEELTYRSRHTLLSSATPVATLSDSMMEMQAPRVSRNRVREVSAVSHPLRIDSAATTELFVLNQEIQIAAGATVTFTGRYIDPSQQAVRVSGTSIVTPLVANTHYKFSSVSGSGTDLNGDLGVTATKNGDSTDFSFINNAAVTGHLWFLKIIGKGVYLYDEIEHISTDTTIKKGQTLTYDMVYQDSFTVGKNVSTSMLTWESAENNERPIVHFKANRSAALMAAAILVEPGALVSITETVTGVSRKFFVNGIELDIKAGGRDIDVYWYCAPAQEGQLFCILNAVGFAELNTTAILAF